MSLFPVVSSLDAVDANYLTIKTAEGFLVHYHDIQRLEEPGASPTPVIPAPATDSNHVRIVSQRQPRRSLPSIRITRARRGNENASFVFSRIFARTRATKASSPFASRLTQNTRTSLFVSAFDAFRASQPLTTWTAGTTPKRPRGT